MKRNFDSHERTIPLETCRNVLRIATACLMALAATTALAITEVAGVKLDDETSLANQKLVLNGAGIRYRLVIKVYVAALYLPQKRDNLKDIMGLPGAKRVAVTMLREISG